MRLRVCVCVCVCILFAYVCWCASPLLGCGVQLPLHGLTLLFACSMTLTGEKVRVIDCHVRAFCFMSLCLLVLSPLAVLLFSPFAKVNGVVSGTCSRCFVASKRAVYRVHIVHIAFSLFAVTALVLTVRAVLLFRLFLPLTACTMAVGRTIGALKYNPASFRHRPSPWRSDQTTRVLRCIYVYLRVGFVCGADSVRLLAWCGGLPE